MVLDDVERACFVSAGGDSGVFSKIYSSSNESLKDLFQCFSLKGKDVLTVLASSDQLFYSYYYGASSVDAFDINYLTKYYYYLRRWSILYQNRFYPSHDMFRTHRSLFKLFDKVQCRSREEEDALLFWETYLNRVRPSQHEQLYCVERCDQSVKDIKKLKSLIEKQELTFYQGDLFGDFCCPKKYDIIITSNILEYAWNSLKLEKAHDHLKGLLKDKGQIIGSHFIFYPDMERFIMEKEYFERDFDYLEFHQYRENSFTKSFPLGYSYTKKC